MKPPLNFVFRFFFDTESGPLGGTRVSFVTGLLSRILRSPAKISISPPPRLEPRLESLCYRGCLGRFSWCETGFRWFLHQPRPPFPGNLSQLLNHDQTAPSSFYANPQTFEIPHGTREVKALCSVETMPPGRNIERPERADFKPLAPNIDIPALISSTPNFQHVTRIDARNINSSTMPDVEAYIHDHVIKKGLPLVIENWHLRSDWSSWIFNVQWLIQNHGQDRINVRDLQNQNDIPMSFGHYLSNLKKLSSKFHALSFDGYIKQRLYGKDLDCPPIWRQTLSDLLPQSTFYLAPIADLMSSLPEPARAENMMCYVGHEGTYTPAHKEMCASLGQNIMIASSMQDELPGNRIGAAGSEGSSVWFMMGREDREVIAEYWLAQLGHDIEVEKHFASVEDLANAPFTVYIVEQKLGDYILVPPLAPHQVWNRGEYTVKAAWNRTTVDTLEFAINEALPKARLVCRDEQYKNRAIIYETLCKYLRVLKSDNDVRSPDYIQGLRSRKVLASDFTRLFNLFNTILLDQCFEVPGKGKHDANTPVDKIPNEYNVACSFCRANIWNRFLSCEKCVVEGEDGDEDCYDVCIDCYARGRSCGCQSGLKWVEQEDWNDLLEKHEEFRSMVMEIHGTVSAQSPKKFYDALAELQRKTVARVCHEQNKLRPFVDVTKDPALDTDDDIAAINAKKKSGQLLQCHVCKVRHDKWKTAACTNPGCSKAYCFGNLWRAFDMDPCEDVLVKLNWKCPVCLGICSCGACQKNPKMKPHHPRGTFLGADTKNFVDPRSVEVLVDFRRGNLSWLKPGEVDPITRLKRKRSIDSDDISMEENCQRQLLSGTWSAINDQEHAVDAEAPALRTLDGRSGTDGYATNHEAHEGRLDQGMGNGRHSEHDDSPSAGGKSGGGQYTLSPKSSSNHPPGKQNIQSDPAIGMAGNRLQREEVSDTRDSCEVDTLQQSQQRLTLPSPSAMLTGSLPPKHSPPGLSSSHFSFHDSTEFNTHSYPYNTSTTENPPSSIGSSEYTSNSHTPNEDSHLSTLERNPLAFIAAAGLMQISNDQGHTFHSTPTTAAPENHVYHYGSRPMLSEIGASGLGMDISGVGPSHVNSNSNNYLSIQSSYSQSSHSHLRNTPPPSYPFLRYTPMIATPKPPPVPAPLPPSLVGPHYTPAGSKGKCKKADNIVGDFEHKNIERDVMKLAWVKHQQKLAKDRHRWKQARRKSKVVTLKISSEKLRELEDRWEANLHNQQNLAPAQADQLDEDLVTTDLPPVRTPKKERKPSLAEKPVIEATPINLGRRVAPGWVEISDDDDVSEGGLDEDVGDDEYRGWGARQFSKRKQATMVPTKKSGRRISRPEFFGKTLTGGKAQRPSSGDVNERYDADNEGIIDDLFGVHQTPTPAPARSESELRRLAEEEEVNRKLEEEKRAEIERLRVQEAEAARKRTEEEAECARKQAEQKAKEETHQQELERGRKRKEEIARAYRESKLLALKVATGEEPLESWEDQQEEEGEEEEEVPVEELLPDWMKFAVVVDAIEVLDRETYEVIDNVEFTEPSVNPGFLVDISGLDINMDTAPPMPLGPLPTTGKRRGRPPKHPTKASTTAVIPSARFSVNPAPPATPTTTTRKPYHPTGGEDGAFKESKPRAARTQGRSLPLADGSDTGAKPKRKRGRPPMKAGQRFSSVAKLQPEASSSAPPPPEPVRVSTRKRKSMIQNYNFVDNEEPEEDNSIPPEMYINDDVDVPTEIIDPIDLELDPDVGVLEREGRMAKLKEKQAQKKRSVSATTPESAGDEGCDEEAVVKIEEEYNSRWRRRTMK